MKKLYLYLARRDKSATRLLSIFPSGDIGATRITDVEKMNLPRSMQSKVQQLVYENRMLWEAWIESAESYQDLKENLRKRGFKNVQPYEMPAFGANTQNVVAKLPSGPTKTMLRKTRTS